MKLINSKNFDIALNSKQVKLFTLENAKGLTCQICNFGGKIVSLWVPDRHGIFEDVVLG